MKPETLSHILRNAPAIEQQKNQYAVAARGRVSFYLGSASQSMTVQGVTGIELADAYVRLDTREMGTFFTTYEAIYAVSSKPPADEPSNRTGFA